MSQNNATIQTVNEIRPIPRDLPSSERIQTALARINARAYGDGVLLVTADRMLEAVDRSERDDSGRVEAAELERGEWDQRNCGDRFE